MTQEQPGAYKTLIAGTLIQRTAFSTGGHDPHGRVDSPVARDGSGRLTLRGSGIAGAFIATASRLFGGNLPPSVTAGAPSEQLRKRRKARRNNLKDVPLRLTESVWRFHTSHPEAETALKLEVRTGVGIRQDTGAAAEGLKYEVETVPAGTRWPFLLEIDEYRDPDGEALPIALHVIDHWFDACVLGRNVARGLGWMRLDRESLRVFQLDATDADLWPDASLTPKEALDALANEERRRPTQERIDEIRAQVAPTEYPPLLGVGTIEIAAGSGEEVWGLDTLSIGAGEAMRDLQDQALSKLGKSRPDETDFDPDLVLAWTRRAGTKQRPLPFIPGSGLRGPLRHTLSWWLRSRQGKPVHDPNSPGGRRELAKQQDRKQLDDIERLFGSGTFGGAMLLSDAELVDPNQFQDDAILFLEHHAEDEFTGGTYAEAKFNRLALVSGKFRFHYLLEARSATELGEFRALLAQLQALGAARQIPIGGANWRGHGWVRWSLELPPHPKHPGSNDMAQSEGKEIAA